MADVQEDAALRREPWHRKFHIYGGSISNTLAAECWADRSPLHEAALQGRLLPLRTLIAQGFDVNVVTVDGVSALHDACLGGHAACARLLVENGAKVNAVTIDGVTPLFDACVSGSVRCVEMLLEHCPLPQSEYPGASPIHEAVKRGHKDCAELLLSKGANIDLEVPHMGTPLYAACLSQKTDCVEMLLRLGADVRRGRGQDSPLHVAARTGGTEVMELLIDHGANVWSRNADGKRPVELIPANAPVEKPLGFREGPAALSQLCRLRVRRLLGPARLHLVPRFQVPQRLIDFLCYR